MPSPARARTPPSPRPSSSSSELSALLDTPDDPTVATLHAKRLAELRAAAAAASSSIAANEPGHGIPVHLAEQQAITTTAAATASLLLFTHRDMAACARMLSHVERVSAAHRSVMCVVVEAESATWLAGRLGVRVLPAVVGMLAGKEVGRLVGFDGLPGGLGCAWTAVEAQARRWGVVTGRRAGGEDEDDEDEERDEGDESSRRRGIRDANGAKRRNAGEDDGGDDSDWD